MEKQLLLTGVHFKYITTCSSSATSITYNLVMSLINKRNFLVKQSVSILYETNVCFKRI